MSLRVIQFLLQMALSLVFAGTAMAADLSHSNLIKRASQLRWKDLPQSGKYSCKQEFSVNPYQTEAPLQVFAKTQRDAQENIYALCVKKKCESLGSQIFQETQILKSLPPDELKMFLQSLAMSQEQIENIMQTLTSESSVQSSHLTCDDVSPPLLIQLIDICLATPVRCR